MKNLNSNITPFRKSVAFNSTMASLLAVTALALAPVADASAEVVKAGARSKEAAMSNAVRQAERRCYSMYGDRSVVNGRWVLNLVWYQNTWFSADLDFSCARMKDNQLSDGKVLVRITNKPSWMNA